MFDFLNKKKNQTEDDNNQQEQYSAAPGTQIRFDPNLISQLEGDHQALLELYGEIKASFDAGEYETATERLEDFRTALQGHLLTENVRLYIYLDHMLASDESTSALIHDFRKEMDAIAKTTMAFLKKHGSNGVDPEQAPGFAEDLATIGEVLGARIKKEEKILYPLYMAQY